MPPRNDEVKFPRTISEFFKRPHTVSIRRYCTLVDGELHPQQYVNVHDLMYFVILMKKMGLRREFTPYVFPCVVEYMLRQPGFSRTALINNLLAGKANPVYPNLDTAKAVWTSHTHQQASRLSAGALAFAEKILTQRATACILPDVSPKTPYSELTGIADILFVTFCTNGTFVRDFGDYCWHFYYSLLHLHVQDVDAIKFALTSPTILPQTTLVICNGTYALPHLPVIENSITIMAEQVGRAPGGRVHFMLQSPLVFFQSVSIQDIHFSLPKDSVHTAAIQCGQFMTKRAVASVSLRNVFLYNAGLQLFFVTKATLTNFAVDSADACVSGANVDSLVFNSTRSTKCKTFKPIHLAKACKFGVRLTTVRTLHVLDQNMQGVDTAFQCADIAACELLNVSTQACASVGVIMCQTPPIVAGCNFDNTTEPTLLPLPPLAPLVAAYPWPAQQLDDIEMLPELDDAELAHSMDDATEWTPAAPLFEDDPLDVYGLPDPEILPFHDAGAMDEDEAEAQDALARSLWSAPLPVDTSYRPGMPLVRVGAVTA